MTRKIKPCEFCAEDRWFTEDGHDGHQLYIEVYPDSFSMAVTSFAVTETTGETEELMVPLPLNYCPNCGRKLTW